jgi:hypothetical protein
MYRVGKPCPINQDGWSTFSTYVRTMGECKKPEPPVPGYMCFEGYGVCEEAMYRGTGWHKHNGEKDNAVLDARNSLEECVALCKSDYQCGAISFDKDVTCNMYRFDAPCNLKENHNYMTQKKFREPCEHKHVDRNICYVGMGTCQAALYRENDSEAKNARVSIEACQAACKKDHRCGHISYQTGVSCKMYKYGHDCSLDKKQVAFDSWVKQKSPCLKLPPVNTGKMCYSGYGDCQSESMYRSIKHTGDDDSNEATNYAACKAECQDDWKCGYVSFSQGVSCNLHRKEITCRRNQDNIAWDTWEKTEKNVCKDVPTTGFMCSNGYGKCTQGMYRTSDNDNSLNAATLDIGVCKKACKDDFRCRHISYEKNKKCVMFRFGFECNPDQNSSFDTWKKSEKQCLWKFVFHVGGTVKSKMEVNSEWNLEPSPAKNPM